MYSRFNDRIVMYMHTRVIYEKKVHRFLFPCAFDKGEIAIINNVVRILCSDSSLKLEQLKSLNESNSSYQLLMRVLEYIVGFLSLDFARINRG